MQLIEIKQDGNDRISNNGSSSEYLERICKDIMANIEVDFNKNTKFVQIFIFFICRRILKLNKV